MLLLKNVIIIDPDSKLDNKKRDVLIAKGIIKDIKVKIEATNKMQVIDIKGACLSIGWVDLGVQINDPGYEFREDLNSVAQAAMAGGYTGLICQPNTKPVIHSKSEVLYIRHNTKDSLVDFYPIGAVSDNTDGKDITEMYDMHHAGAVAFSDGKYAIQNNGLMMRALQYVKAFDGTIINRPHDYSIGGKGMINEGRISTLLGLKGLPKLAEEMMVLRDIYLADYTDSKLHIANISTAKSVQFIKRAKKRKIKVTVSVAAINLALDDTILETFDSNYKVLPPLREVEDIQALKDGLKDGTIDIISSNHRPVEEEAKKLDFFSANFGAIGLQTAFALSNTHLKSTIRIKKLIQKIAYNPRKIFGLPIPEIKIGAKANLTFFHPNEEWTYLKKDIKSKSSNSPFIGKTFKGKVLATINNGKYSINN